MPNAFQKGDVVVLKSGGPPMTVDEVPGGETYMGSPRKNYLLRWFKGATADSGVYDEHVLMKYLPPKKSK